MENKPEKYYGPDRRKYPRVNAAVSYAVLEEEPAGKTQNTKNISAGGIAFFSKNKVDVNVVLSLTINLPDLSQVKTKARVAWNQLVNESWCQQTNYELGIEFIEIDENDRQKIAKYA